MKNQKRRGRMRMAVEGAEMLQEVCHEIVNNQGNFVLCTFDISFLSTMMKLFSLPLLSSIVDLSSWKKKIIEEKMSEYDDNVEISETIEVSTYSKEFLKEVFCSLIDNLICFPDKNSGYELP